MNFKSKDKDADLPLISKATVNRSVTVPIRQLLMRAQKVWKVPCRIIDWNMHLLKEPQERIREAKQFEEAAMFSKLSRGYDDAVEFAIQTGARLAEIVGLEWSAVDFFSKRITLFGKGDKRRTIPMTPVLREVLVGAEGFSSDEGLHLRFGIYPPHPGRSRL